MAKVIKERLTLSMDKEVIKQIKIHSLLNDTNISTIVERLLQEYLKTVDNVADMQKK